jgi:hypothetical protein
VNSRNERGIANYFGYANNSAMPNTSPMLTSPGRADRAP